MVRIPPWFWIAIPVIGMLAVGIRGATQASYFRGIADDAESRLEAQALVLESVSVRADSLGRQIQLQPLRGSQRNVRCRGLLVPAKRREDALRPSQGP